MRVRLLAFAVGLLVVWRADAGIWPQVGGDAAHSGSAPDGPTNTGRSVWRVMESKSARFVSHATPVVAGGRVFANARAYEENVHVENRLYAFSAETGAPLWSTPIEPDVLSSWSSPAVYPDGGVVIVGSGQSVTAMDVATGEPRWATPLDGYVVNASPTVSEGLVTGGERTNRVYITDFSIEGAPRLYAINVDPHRVPTNPHEPGDVVWSAPLNGASGATPAFNAGRVVVATVGGEVCCFDARSGQPLWTRPIPGAGFFGGVAIRNGFVYAASYNFFGGSNNSVLCKVSLATGQLRWVTPCERTDSIPIVPGDGRIYLAGGTAGFGSAVRVQAFVDGETSTSLAWDTHAATGGALSVGGWATHAAYSNGLLYVGVPPATGDPLNPYPELCVLDTTRPPTHPAFVRSRRSGAGGSTAIANGRIYSFGTTGLHCLTAASTAGPSTLPDEGDILIGNGSGLIPIP